MGTAWPDCFTNLSKFCHMQQSKSTQLDKKCQNRFKMLSRSSKHWPKTENFTKVAQFRQIWSHWKWTKSFLECFWNVFSQQCKSHSRSFCVTFSLSLSLLQLTLHLSLALLLGMSLFKRWSFSLCFSVQYNHLVGAFREH